MLASIIANLQNVPQAETRLPTIKIDRGGGGPLCGRYDIVDIIAAAQSFPEVAGEDPLARAARRTRWIGEALPYIRDARERREGAAFLAGAVVADAAAEERHRAANAQAEERRKLVDQLKIEQLVEIIDDVRGTVVAPAPGPRSRGTGSSAGAIALALGVGVALGIALGRSSRSSRR